MDQRTKPRTRRVFGFGVAAIALLALTVFKVPLGTVLLAGLFLLCPLMMAGMHGGHTHDDRAGGDRQDSDVR